MTDATPFLTMVVPARDEADLIAGSLQQLDRELRRLGRSFEIVLSDSASHDDTVARALEAGVADLRVVHELLPGKGRALSRGLTEARGRYVGFIDSDLEIDPAYIAPMLVRLEEGADAVIASKVTGLGSHARPLRRRLATGGYNRLARSLFRTPYADHQAGLKLFRRDIILDVLPRVESRGWAWDTEVLVLLHRRGYRVDEVPVVAMPTREGRLSMWRVSLELTRGLAGVYRRQRGHAAESDGR